MARSEPAGTGLSCALDPSSWNGVAGRLPEVLQLALQPSSLGRATRSDNGNSTVLENCGPEKCSVLSYLLQKEFQLLRFYLR